MGQKKVAPNTVSLLMEVEVLKPSGAKVEPRLCPFLGFNAAVSAAEKVQEQRVCLAFCVA